MHPDHVDRNTELEGVTGPKKLIFCKVKNVVYLMSCGICEDKYIGQTSNCISVRMNNHRACIKKFKMNVNNTYTDTEHDVEYQHFSTHDFENIKLKVLTIEPDHEKRRIMEDFFILSNKSIYPYGLNTLFCGQRIDSNVNDNSKCIYKMFTINYKGISRGQKVRVRRPSKGFKRYVDFKDILKEFESSRTCDIVYRLIRLRISILKSLIRYTLKVVNANCRIGLIILDIGRFRIKNYDHFIKETTGKGTMNLAYCLFMYRHSIFDAICFSKIHKKHSKLFPIDKVTIKYGFKYKVTMGRKLFNYNTFCKNLDDVDPEALTCLCGDPNYYEFLDRNLGHIVTGNLGIVKSNNLREIMEKGTKYRLGERINLGFLKKQIFEDLTKFVVRLTYRYKIPFCLFSDWIEKMHTDIMCKLYCEVKRLKKEKYLNLKLLKDDIVDLQSKFIIVPVDKAFNNFGIICKKFYFSILKDELESNSTYEKIHTNIDIIKKRCIAFNKNLKIGNLNTLFPYVFAIPKFHKSPISFRFITCGNNSYNKQAGFMLKKYLDIISAEILKSDNYIIHNSSNICKILRNSSIPISRIDTFDFSNLFTSIDLTDLKFVLKFYFHEYKDLVDKDSDFLTNLIEFCISNHYVSTGSTVFLQIRGIAMGSKFSSAVADLYLHYYENKQFNFIKNNGIIIKRYIDDVIVFNIKDENLLRNIYPPDLVLKNTSTNANFVNFLDLRIDCDSRNTVIYDKRDDYDFKVLFLLNWTSLVSIRVKRNLIISELNRIKNICTAFSDIHSAVSALEYKLTSNNFPSNFIKVYFKNFKKHLGKGT
jgi:hypothetical protein